MLRRSVHWAFVLFWSWGAGCSFVLDPDELVAERKEVGDDTVGDLEGPDGEDGDSDGGDGDTTVLPDADDSRDADDTEDALDTDAPGDGDSADTSDSGDATDPSDTGDGTTEPHETDAPDLVEDSEILDTFSTEVDPTEVSEDTSSETDSTPEVQLIVRTSGEGDCTLDYYLQSLTSCPKTCGWTLVFDARASRGLSSFSWRFEVSGGYLVTPESSVGAVASVVISTPACLFFPAGSMRPATVTASVSADGGAWVEAATIPFSVRQVEMCGASLCEAP